MSFLINVPVNLVELEVMKPLIRTMTKTAIICSSDLAPLRYQPLGRTGPFLPQPLNGFRRIRPPVPRASWSFMVLLPLRYGNPLASTKTVGQQLGRVIAYLCRHPLEKWKEPGRELQMTPKEKGHLPFLNPRIHQELTYFVLKKDCSVTV